MRREQAQALIEEVVAAMIECKLDQSDTIGDLLRELRMT